MVLTFDQSRWKNEWAAYRGAIHCWARLRKRLTRAFGPIGYIQTWERNVNSPFPHVNIVVNNAAIARLCAGDGGKKFHSRWLTPNAVRCGFGKVTYAQGMKSADAMAGYVAKLAKELTGAGEKNQVPVNAPRHFRRIRASRGMLPPVHKTGDWTGELVQMPVEAWNRVVQDRNEKILSHLGSGRTVRVYNPNGEELPARRSVPGSLVDLAEAQCQTPCLSRSRLRGPPGVFAIAK
jgi:hypothetical protein